MLSNGNGAADGGDGRDVGRSMCWHLVRDQIDGFLPRCAQLPLGVLRTYGDGPWATLARRGSGGWLWMGIEVYLGLCCVGQVCVEPVVVVLKSGGLGS